MHDQQMSNLLFFQKREVRRSSPSLLLFNKRLIFNLSTQHNTVFSIEQELSDCVSLENGNGSHHITSSPLLSLLIRMKSVGILYPATEPCQQISPQPAQLAVSCGCEIKVLAAAPRSKKREQGPYRQLRRLISPERLLTVGTSRKEDLERGWLFLGRLIVRLQNSLFVFLNC